MVNKQGMKKKATHNYKINQTSSEIPTLIIEQTKSNAEFITEHILLSASGWNIQEAMGGMDYLIDRHNKLQKNKKGDK